jgi:hypothetical protein
MAASELRFRCVALPPTLPCTAGNESTYKKQEVKTPSTGTPKITFDFLRGILPGLHPRALAESMAG